MYFRNYRLWKTWLENSLRGAVSEHAFPVNMWKRPKYLQNPHESAFIMFFQHPSEKSSFKKCLPSCYVKSYGCLLTHWLPMASILIRISRICHSQFKCNYLKDQSLFLNFLFHFWNLHQILNILKKRMIVIANIFAKLETVKNFFRPLSKKRRLRRHFESQHVKVSQILAESLWERFYNFFPSFSGKLIWKMSPIDFGETFRVFLNTLIADDKYSAQDCENSLLPIQMILSEKPIAFCELFVPFLESTSNFKNFERKGVHHS